jgi:amino acid transporter
MIRGITLRAAVSLNVITMIGIGPLITIPLVLSQLAGPLALAGWVAGALVALCDGLVWAELGSRFPGSGGTYVYLRQVFGPTRWGRLLAFLFNWQFFLSASLVISTGYIGFANYAAYLIPNVGRISALNHLVALCIGIVTILLLYRRITSIASFGVVLAVLSVGTLLLVGIAGYSHADFHRAFTLAPQSSFGLGFLSGLGGALYITLYDYLGYSQIALVGEEVREPARTLPRAIVTSILIVLALYVFLQIGVLSAVRWETLVGHNGAPPPAQAQYVASTVVATAWGFWPARILTIMVLLTAFASVYGGLLGASRVPFAAARDGAFLPFFAKLHPTKHFPYVSLLAMGFISLVACFFDLSFVIAVISTSSILIGSVAQIFALFVFRAHRGAAPFRMWLYPLPAIVALAGWTLAFTNTGTLAIALGVGWLVAGVVVYLAMARAQHAWPFAVAVSALLLLAAPAQARADGLPFVYGATFFYERVPRAQWSNALAYYRSMGINTIDLYVIWNWHEPQPGSFDFTGKTNPRRDLVGLLKLIDADGFKIILRPGPVIRNEWRNGGYPAWLLQRRAYGMPQRDILEGRYPATATLQNEHSDAAAAQWLHNTAHMHYAARWLAHALRVVAPWRRDVIAVALDDDQGAYLDNDTWPGANFHRYIAYLASVVRSRWDNKTPLFINTYQMKVTASAPAWAWGNWYQSDAYSIGEHDRAQLEFSTGLLQTQPRRAVMISEFQAGWLQGADQAWPRPADPTNTTLALHTMLQQGAHGIVNFPVQDTLNPAGWEAPWTNAFYSWDAAVSVQLSPQARFAPTQRFGTLVQRYGSMLARTHPAADAAIAYLTSAYDPTRISNDDIGAIAQATIRAQRGCRIMRISCRLVDLRFDPLSDLEHSTILIMPPAAVRLPYITAVQRKLEMFRKHGGQIVAGARHANVVHAAAGRIPGATLLVSQNERFAFLDVVNYARSPLHAHAAVVRSGHFSASIPSLSVAPRDAMLLALYSQHPNGSERIQRAQPASATEGERLPLRTGSFVRTKYRMTAGVYNADVYGDGYPAVVLANAKFRLIVSPCAGARALIFEDRSSGENLFTTIGGLRDGWTPQLPASARDYIAKYTHPITTGTFNRCYATHLERKRAVFTYTAPDAPPHGASYVKTVTIAGSRSVEVSTRVRFAHDVHERAMQITSFAIPRDGHAYLERHACAVYAPSSSRLVFAVWAAAHSLHATFKRHAGDALLTITYGADSELYSRYGFQTVHSLAQAQAALRLLANRPESYHPK